jgi:hypothetical protein
VEYFACNVTRLGERGATSGGTGWFAPVSCLHLAEGRHSFYRIFLICASTSFCARSNIPTKSITLEIGTDSIKIRLCGHIYADFNSRSQQGNRQEF